MSEFNRHTFPNGGWQFRQPQTNWVNPMAMVGFDASVKAIIAHRVANKAATSKYQLATDYDAVADELEKFTRMRLGIPLQQAPSFQAGRSQLPAGVVAVATNVKRAAQGTAVVLDWLTSGGKPVDQALANQRAATCAACPKNVDGAWYTVAPASIIKATLEARNDLKLETPDDAKLRSCGVCLCLNRLKVWCPMEHIVKETRPEIMAEFPANCWIKTGC